MEKEIQHGESPKGDSNWSHDIENRDYYYDDSTGYEVYKPDDGDEQGDMENKDQNSERAPRRGIVSVSSWALRGVLVLLGVVNVLIGINVGFGGMQTLGLQGQTKFLEITDPHIFMVQDSHIRFFGGLYLGIGLFLVFAVTHLHRYRTALNLIFFVIFMGGLARLTMNRPDVLFSSEIIGSFVVEIFLMPILYFWLASAVKE